MFTHIRNAQRNNAFDFAVQGKDVATKRALLESESDKIFRSYKELIELQSMPESPCFFVLIVCY